MAYLALRDFTSAKRYSPARVAKNGIVERLTYRLLLFADCLRGVDVAECDYATALRQAAAERDAFVFLDPPYEPLGQKKSYRGHAKELFDTDFDFDRFSRCVRAVESRFKFMITINDSEANRQRFDSTSTLGFWNL